jgi:putative FmdB family regulatory protein
MPVYDYRCSNCSVSYDIFHKGKELPENIVCPKCGSKEYKKLMSVMSVKMGNTASSGCESGECGINGGPYSGGCAGGMCGLN